MTDVPPQAASLDITALDAAVDNAIASCDDDPRAAVRALLITLDAYEAELTVLKQEVARISTAVSPGFTSGRLGG